MPRPADTDPEQNHQEWHSAGGEIKVRPRIFERTLQILRNFCCTQNGLLRSCTYEKVFLWCPSESRLRPVSPKRSNCVLHGSKGYLRAHLAFQALITSSELEIVLSELWLHFFFLKTVYLGSIQWSDLRLNSSSWCWRETKSPALRNGISSPANKMLGCRRLAHCGTRRTNNSILVFIQ